MQIIKRITLLLLIVILFSNLTTAQEKSGRSNIGRIEDDFKFLPIPYINYNRSIGFQIGAAPMLQFNPIRSDTLSPSSIAGLFGMYSENKAYFAMAMAKLYFDEDNWRFLTAGGLGSVNFQFYIDLPIDMWVPYNTKMKLFYIEAQRRIYERIYMGLSYIHLNIDTETEVTEGVFSQKLNGFGLKVSMDYRKNVYYPRESFVNNIKYFSYPEFMGNEDGSSKIELDHNHFFSIREKQDVIAARVYAGFGLGELSFNQQFIVGRGDDLRGYSKGEYRGDGMVAMQGEYRWNLKESKFSFVGFFGLATVFGAINEEHNGKILPGVGAGFRFNVSEETHLNIGMDIAQGVDDWGLYFRIGEAFNK